MLEMCHSLGIKSHIQQEAVLLLADTRRGFMRSDLLRERLIKSLGKNGYPAIFLPKINSEVEALVEQQLVRRQIRSGAHEIGLHKVVWKIPSETIDLIREATQIICDEKLFPVSSHDLVNDVKRQIRKMGASRSGIGDDAFEILVARFRSPPAISTLSSK